MEEYEEGAMKLSKLQMQRADIAREYFANRKAQTKIVKQRITHR